MNNFYRNKLAIIQAIEWKGNNAPEIFDFCNKTFISGRVLYLRVNDDSICGNIGCYIIRYPDGRFTILSKEDFNSKYEKR